MSGSDYDPSYVEEWRAGKVIFDMTMVSTVVVRNSSVCNVSNIHILSVIV